jgi:hypothetical protein
MLKQLYYAPCLPENWLEDPERISELDLLLFWIEEILEY